MMEDNPIYDSETKTWSVATMGGFARELNLLNKKVVLLEKLIIITAILGTVIGAGSMYLILN